MEAMTECCEIKLIKLSLGELKRLRGLSFGRIYGGGDRGYAEFFEKHGGAVTALLRPYGNCEEVKCLMTEYDKVLCQARVFDQLSKYSFSSALDKGKAETSLMRIINEFRYHSKNIVSKIENGKLRPEKPAEIQQSQRTEIPSEIKLMKQIAEHLRIWFRERSDDKCYPSGTVPLRFRNGISLKLEFEVYLDQVLTWLRVNDQKKIARSLEQERDSFLSDLQAVEQAIERGDNPPLELIELRSKITGLIGTLEHTAKVFTDKLATEKPAGTGQAKRRSIIGRIVEVIIALALLAVCSYVFGVVTGIFIFAALLTIFHLLGWLEPIRAFIYDLLLPE